MALVKCRECGQDVSSKAKSCPSCGVKSPAGKKAGCLSVLAVIILFIVIGNALNDWDKQGQTAAPQKSTADFRMDQIKSGFSSWDGSHRELTKLIKSAMNDPDSYEHVKTTYSDKGDHLLVKTSFRGNNAFGGKVVNWIIVEASMDGKVLRVVKEGR